DEEHPPRDVAPSRGSATARFHLRHVTPLFLPRRPRGRRPRDSAPGRRPVPSPREELGKEGKVGQAVRSCRSPRFLACCSRFTRVSTGSRPTNSGISPYFNRSSGST